MWLPTYPAPGLIQIGRYPLHMHHLDGPAQPQANGYEFTLIGNAIDGGDTPNDHKWGIDIHATDGESGI